METIEILSLGNGWYDFKNVPQGYVKVHGKPCKNDQDAINYAMKINVERKPLTEVKIVEASNASN